LILIGVLIVFRDRFDPLLVTSWIGDTLIILASALLGLTILRIRTVTNYVSPFQATFWQMSFFIPAFWLTAFISEYSLKLLQISPSLLLSEPNFSTLQHQYCFCFPLYLPNYKFISQLFSVKRADNLDDNMGKLINNIWYFLGLLLYPVVILPKALRETLR
jgi:hypothetical protein